MLFPAADCPGCTLIVGGTDCYPGPTKVPYLANALALLFRVSLISVIIPPVIGSLLISLYIS